MTGRRRHAPWRLGRRGEEDGYSAERAMLRPRHLDELHAARWPAAGGRGPCSRAGALRHRRRCPSTSKTTSTSTRSTGCANSHPLRRHAHRHLARPALLNGVCTHRGHRLRDDHHSTPAATTRSSRRRRFDRRSRRRTRAKKIVAQRLHRASRRHALEPVQSRRKVERLNDGAGAVDIQRPYIKFTMNRPSGRAA